jgi:hypothetical protein
MRLGHERCVHLVSQRRFARRALEHECLVGEIQRIAVQQVDFHLRRTVFVDQGVDRDVLLFAELVDVVEQRIEFIDGRDAVRLATGLRAPRTTDRRLERIIRVDVGFNQIKLELRGNHRLPTPRRIQVEHVAQHLARRHLHASAVGVETIVNHLRRGLGRPGHATHGARVGLQNHVDFRRAHRRRSIFGIITRHGLQKNALGQAHALLHLELLRRHQFAARDAGHVRHDRLDFLNAVVAEKL